MVGAEPTLHAAPLVAPAPPPPVHGSVEPRAVEETAGATLNSGQDEGIYLSPAAALLLLRSSAEVFAKVLEVTEEPTAAGAASGFSVAGADADHVDTYA